MIVGATVVPAMLKGGAPATLVEMDGHRTLYSGALPSPLTTTALAGATKAAPSVKQLAAVPDVSNWVGFNIQFAPDAEVARRKAAGEGKLEETVHPLADKAHSYFPVNLCGWPNIDARDIYDYLDPVTGGATRTNGIVWRDPFNVGQLDEAGRWLGPGRAEWLDQVVSAGGRILSVHAAQHNERPSFPAIAGGPAAVRAEFEEWKPRSIEASRRYVRMMMALPPSHQRAWLAHELENEPAFPGKVMDGDYGDVGLTRRQVLDHFEDTCTASARAAIEEGLPDHVVLVFPKFRYDGSAAELLELDEWQQCMFDRWRQEFGNRIAMSAHMYPGWFKSRSDEQWRAKVLDEWAKLSAVPQVVTEMNGGNFSDAAVSAFDESSYAGWVWPELAAEGFGLMTFPIANWGPGSFFSTLRQSGKADDCGGVNRMGQPLWAGDDEKPQQS